MEKLYRFSVSLGRMGKLDGIFSADEKDVADIIGENVYFGECLGKHSEIKVRIEEKHFTLLTEDEDFIEKFNQLECASGINPFDYYDEEEEDS